LPGQPRLEGLSKNTDRSLEAMAPRAPAVPPVLRVFPAGTPDTSAGKPAPGNEAVGGNRLTAIQSDDAMADPVICLHCGGEIEPRPRADGARVRACNCYPAFKEAKSVRCPSCGGSIKVGTRACPYCSSTVATCRCATCLSWNLAGAAHCQDCGRPLVSADGRGGQAAGCNCPRCGALLQAREYAEMSVDECDRCGGLFLTPAMLDRIVAVHDGSTGLRLALPKRAVQREANVQYLRCPVCAKFMNRQAFGRFSGVIIDVCKADGMWFDAGELAEVIRFVQQGGLDFVRDRERQEQAEQERRSRTEAAIAEVTAGFQADETDTVLRSRTGNSMFADLLHSIVKAWR
jgi:Zn-finger nucleic acid-binding protein